MRSALLDLALDTTATVILIALTTLAWARFRERNVIAAACHSGAFVALSTAYGVAVVVSVLNALTSAVARRSMPRNPTSSRSHS